MHNIINSKDKKTRVVIKGLEIMKKMIEYFAEYIAEVNRENILDLVKENKYS